MEFDPDKKESIFVENGEDFGEYAAIRGIDRPLHRELLREMALVNVADILQKD